MDDRDSKNKRALHRRPKPAGGWIFLRQRPPLNDGGSPLFDYVHKRSRATACFTVEHIFTDGKTRKHLSLVGHSQAALPAYLKQFGLAENAPISMDGLGGRATHFFDPPLPTEYEEPSFIEQAREHMAGLVSKIWPPRSGTPS